MLVEHFADLERLCNQIYDDRHGITKYIDEMKHTQSYKPVIMSSWQITLEKLIAVRHKRNQLSHGEVSFSSKYATEDDIDFLIDFRRSILNQTDPLALYRKHLEHQITSTPEPRSSHHISAQTAKVRFLVFLAAVLSFVLVIFFAIVFLF